MSGDLTCGDKYRQQSRAPGSIFTGSLLVAFCCGVILLYRLSMLPAWQLLCAAFISVLVLAAVFRNSPACKVLMLCAALTGGVGWAAFNAAQRLHEALPAELEGVPLTVSGYVCSLPSKGGFNSLRFDFCVVENSYRDGAESAVPVPQMPSLLRLVWYGDHPGQLPDQRLRITVKLKRPHGGLNPAGFRYEDWLFRHGYRATGSVKSVEPDHTFECGLHCQYRRQHSDLLDWVTLQFGDARHFGLLASLLMGHRGAMDAEHWDTLQRTGTIHLVAISGLHLGLVALGIGYSARRLILRAPANWLSEAGSRRLVFVLVLLGCLVYALMSGFTVPTRRALLMIAVLGWAGINGWQTPPWRSLLLALTAVLIADPFSPLDAGFWLSFSAVAILILVFSGRLGAVGGVKSLVLAQIAMFAGLWPGLLMLGQDQPLAGFVANLFAIPWVSLVVMPLLLCGALLVAVVPACSGLVSGLSDSVLGALWQGLHWLAELNAPVVHLDVATATGFAAAVLLALWYPQRGFRLAVVIAAALWLISQWAPQGPLTNRSVTQPQIIVWDVGQGLSVLVRHQQQALLYDTGPAVPDLFSAVDSVLLPNLRALGVRQLNALVLSHADGDHSGGLQALITGLPVTHIISGEAQKISARLAGVGMPARVNDCARQKLRIGRLELDFWRSAVAKEGNNASCVLRIRDPDSALEWLLPGDITTTAEAEYLSYLKAQADPAQTRSTRVLLAPHHGSKTSSSAALIRNLEPDVVIYSAGYHHRYGHPHPTVTRRYASAGSRQLNTACTGALIMQANTAELAIQQTSQQASFWISGPGLARAECSERLRTLIK